MQNSRTNLLQEGQEGVQLRRMKQGFFFREFPRIQLNYHLACNQNLELCSSTVLCCSAERSRYDGSTLNPRYQVRTCTAHHSVLKFMWQFCVYRGCPTYTVFTTADSTTAIFGLCMRKWGIFALVGDPLQSH